MNGLPDFCTIDPAGVCSTPFGITDEWTWIGHVITASPSECSTPFGITDEWTKNTVAVTPATRLCSTPFGITDEWT